MAGSFYSFCHPGFLPGVCQTFYRFAPKGFGRIQAFCLELLYLDMASATAKIAMP